MRQSKDPKERMLRKLLGCRLAQLEPELMRGEFHDSETNRFKDDDFFEKASPIVYAITGTPESCSDEELSGGGGQLVVVVMLIYCDCVRVVAYYFC